MRLVEGSRRMVTSFIRIEDKIHLVLYSNESIAVT